MIPDQPWRALTVLAAATAAAGMVGAGITSGSTAAPLPTEGRPPADASAHRDDMTASAGRPERMESSRWQAPRGEPDRPRADGAAPRRDVEPEGVAREPAAARGADDPAPAEAGAVTLSPHLPAALREPMILEVPELGIDSPVVPTTMDDGGSVLVPDDVITTAWFDGSRRLGARQGSTVIVGHRDSATQGTGALYGIEELPPGSRVRVTGRGGHPFAYVVQSVEFVDKANLPAEAPRIFSREGPPRLVLITCGGEFDPSAGSYLSNVVVTAVPAPGPDNRP